MLGYRCFFLGKEGHFSSVAEFKAKGDPEAIELARHLYVIHVESVQWHYGFEVWQGARRVYCEPKP